jgi:hypothetical protein
MLPPKKNRENVSMPVLQLSVDTLTGKCLYEPNTLVFAAYDGELLRLPTLPDTRSIISGQPAVVYHVDDLRIPLTPDELVRLAQRALTPYEYFRLRNHYGDAFDWHDDFYDEATGVALQPTNS